MRQKQKHQKKILIKSQKQPIAVDDELIAMKRNKVEIWQQAEDRAKQYLLSARKKRIEAERELRKLEK